MARPKKQKLEQALTHADSISAAAKMHRLRVPETHQALITLAVEVWAQRELLEELTRATAALCDHCDRSQHPNKRQMRSLVAACRAALANITRNESDE